MSIWNLPLPLPVHMPEVRTPTPMPAVQRPRPFGRYGVALLAPSRADLADACAELASDPGAEQVRRCAVCGACSTESLTGARGWRVLQRSSEHESAFCPECFRAVEPLRVTLATRYAAACELARDAAAALAVAPNCPDAQAAAGLARFVRESARTEWLAYEPEGSQRRAS